MNLRTTHLGSSCLGCLMWLQLDPGWDCNHLRDCLGLMSNTAHSYESELLTICWDPTGLSASESTVAFPAQWSKGNRTFYMAAQISKHECTSEHDRSCVTFSDSALDVMQSHFCILLVTNEAQSHPDSRRDDTEHNPPQELCQRISIHFLKTATDEKQIN